MERMVDVACAQAELVDAIAPRVRDSERDADQRPRQWLWSALPSMVLKVSCAARRSGKPVDKRPLHTPISRTICAKSWF
ncbi:hypothetical protein [Leifsonia shinshuensis]|uniref:hypothetical protein n=1 Tax=Leifsonia shinshuensis TaxID=150026 RepID=UPI002854F60A|nr:hypothetical protein [Leifsonia shinshuensis]MDR6970920.1 hypothetical protein [Leifsonia shinshuensis]